MNIHLNLILPDDTDDDKAVGIAFDMQKKLEALLSEKYPEYVMGDTGGGAGWRDIEIIKKEKSNE